MRYTRREYRSGSLLVDKPDTPLSLSFVFPRDTERTHCLQRHAVFPADTECRPFDLQS